MLILFAQTAIVRNFHYLHTASYKND